MTQRRTLLTGALATAGLVAVVPAWAQALVRTSFGPTTTDISTGHAGHSSLPQALGYWREEGLQSEVFGIAGNTAGLQLISAGNIDFISIVGEELMQAQVRGIPLRAVYMHARQPISRIVVTKASGIASLAELKGKAVGMPVLGPSPYAAAMFKEAGIDMQKDIRLVATGTGAPALLALRRGDIAGWISWDTAVAGLENRGMEFTEFRPGYFNELFGNAVIAREEMIRDRPQLVVGMCRAIAKAVHFGLANPDAAIRIHWRAYPQTKPQGGDEARLLEEARRVFLARFNSYALNGVANYGESLPAQWKRVADQMKEAGELPQDFDPARAYTNQFVEQINAWDRSAVEAQARGWTGN
ncbi:ABC transporter substrate-binding protein [Roseomonas sp. NAR14]|uniref:ABC transporter substrate-binding protein n=1 Tax=Roseomonas acroporae TaxID=2937791 RepID=A0A9X1Y6G4_9PROT|nr:ABC transporter substrate-binding protein [Roseomonas acroporae]MCK8784401.1 ABC transporter substrate-binding protein [Roseomonas acroporae]